MSNVNKKIKDFWDEQHKIETFSALSGCEYDYTIDFLKLNNLIKSKIRVLEIGVGLGYVTKKLFDNDIEVHAVDVSAVGLDRVKEYCKNTYSIDELDKVPSDYFDVIICNRVIIHVPTDQLLSEFKEFIRSLKKGGTFAIQFYSSTKFEDNGIDADFYDARAGRLCRTYDCMKKYIESLDGKSTLVWNEEISIMYISGNNVMHVTK